MACICLTEGIKEKTIVADAALCRSRHFSGQHPYGLLAVSADNRIVSTHAQAIQRTDDVLDLLVATVLNQFQNDLPE